VAILFYSTVANWEVWVSPYDGHHPPATITIYIAMGQVGSAPNSLRPGRLTRGWLPAAC